MLAVCLWAAFTATSPRRAAAQSVERHMIVSAVDTDGRPVAGLTSSDFLVREDGAAREVLRVTPATEERQIAVLVDTSQAAQEIVSDLRRGVTTFVDAMSDGNEIALISFGGTPRILTESTRSLLRLHEGVGGIFAFPDSASYLLNAVRETIQGFARRGAERPVIVVLTTLGLDYSTRDARELIDQLTETGTAFYAVVFRSRQAEVVDQTIAAREIEERRLERNRLLDLGSERSGGTRRDLQSSSAAPEIMMRLADDLRSQYLVVYSRPDTLIPPERIEVEATRGGVTARGTVLNAGD